MAEVVYILCAMTSTLCALLLWRKYRASRTSLLLWSSICFWGLALNNALLFTDLVLVPSVDLLLMRQLTGLISLCVLIYGLITDS